MRRIVFCAFALFILPGCTYSLNLHSRDGETLSGKYRFAREGTGLIRLIGPDGEVLTGKFVTVGRGTFIERYEKIFGTGAIVVDTPDVSAYGNAFGSSLASSHALTETAYGETFKVGSGSSRVAVTGPLFYWTVILRGDRGTTMGCYFIGSSYTAHGFGRCKSPTGKEYTAEF